MKINGYMVFDVESVGLHGEGFAVGWVALNLQGTLQFEGILGVDPRLCEGSIEGLKWVEENCPDRASYSFSKSPDYLRRQFWLTWLVAKQLGYLLVADCSWPVEARFLSDCIRDDPEHRESEGPYPLIDMPSIILAVGDDSLKMFDRLEDELPIHNPLNDARQSSRILATYLKLNEHHS